LPGRLSPPVTGGFLASLTGFWFPGGEEGSAFGGGPLFFLFVRFFAMLGFSSTEPGVPRAIYVSSQPPTYGGGSMFFGGLLFFFNRGLVF